jgi:hypothetical protein
MSIDFIKVKKMFESIVVELKEEVERKIEEKKLAGNIVTGAWFNDSIVIGYLSYFPNANHSEDSCDFIIQLDTKSAIYTSEVCTSSGKILFPIDEINIDLRIEVDWLSKLVDLLENSAPKFIAWFNGQDWDNINMK